MSKFIDLKGQRFGRLIVIEFICRKKSHSIFNCKCDCGKFKEVSSNSLRTGRVRSCGCFSIESTLERSITHGLSKHPLYTIWTSMRNRCYYPKHNRRENYQKKGIIVCDEWKNDFKTFYDWSIANGWRLGLSIDRRENSGNYCPSNCKYSTNKEQQRNRTTNVLVTYKGITKILIEWTEHFNLNYERVRKRLKKGWPPEESFFGKNNSDSKR